MLPDLKILSVVVAEHRRDARRIPGRTESMPIEAKTTWVILFTLVPLNSAASGLRAKV